MSDALIDDCALAALMKPQGPLALALTRRVVSLRAYPRFRDIGAMVSRSAYAQLGYSPIRLIGVVAGMALTFLAAPALALFGSDAAALIGRRASWRCSPAERLMIGFDGLATVAVALPLIAAATVNPGLHVETH